MSSSPFHGIFSFGQTQDGTPANGVETTILQEIPLQEPAEPQKPVPLAKQLGQIAVDIYEQDSYYIIRAPIAGVRLSDLDIEVDDKVVTITGSRRLTDALPESQYYLQECFWGEFSRSVTLPCTVDPRKVKATFSKDSVLKILIPKEERVKIVRISEGS